MDVEAFKRAQEAYSAGDYETALAGFAAVLSDASELAPADLSKFYHLIGNCYVKSGNSRAASAAYARALTGSPDSRRPALYVNLGTALLASDKDAEALAAFNHALEYDFYETPHKALAGVGAAELKLGNTTAAATAYRSAALDESNPAPGRALVNLGVCFMKLGRTQDAITSYEAAREVGLDEASYAQACANLGQAYMAEGRVARAIEAFEQATDGGAELSAIAEHDYELALALNERIGSRVPGIFDTGFIYKMDVLPEGHGAASGAVSGPTEMTPTESGHLPVFGEPGFDPFAPQTQQIGGDAMLEETLSELGVEGDRAAGAAGAQGAPAAAAAAAPETEVISPVASSSPTDGAPTGYAALDDLMPSPEDSALFDSAKTSRDRERERERARETRKRHGIGLKVAIFCVCLLVVICGACVCGYIFGFGYPTQESVAEDFITAVQIDASTKSYWASDVEGASRRSQEAIVSGVASTSVEAVTRASASSTVYVAAELAEGGEAEFAIVMSRKNITWAIEYVELYYASQAG